MKKLKTEAPDLTAALKIMAVNLGYQLACVATAMDQNIMAIGIATERIDMMNEFIEMGAPHNAARMVTRACDALVSATEWHHIADEAAKVADATKARIAELIALNAPDAAITTSSQRFFAGERITEAAEYEAGR